jgi:hypothetical protein
MTKYYADFGPYQDIQVEFSKFSSITEVLIANVLWCALNFTKTRVASIEPDSAKFPKNANKFYYHNTAFMYYTVSKIYKVTGKRKTIIWAKNIIPEQEHSSKQYIIDLG